MGSIILGGIGSALGGPIGGLIGGQIGSLIDSRLLNSNYVAKPSLQDLMIEASTFGLPVPIAYGRNRIAGNMIQSDQLIKVSKHSGKGGASKGSSSDTFSFSGAIAICAGPIFNVWRIYADSKVIWDMDPLTTAAGEPLPQSTFVNGQFGGVAGFYHFGKPGSKSRNTQSANGGGIIYYGLEDQPQDPNLDAIAVRNGFNSGEIPGYRDLAYVVFDTFQLADYGNRIPNFSFEVNGFFEAGTIYSQLPIAGDVSTLNIFYDILNSTYWQYGGANGVSSFNSLDLSQIQKFDYMKDPLITAIVGTNPVNTGGYCTINNNNMTGPDGALWLTEVEADGGCTYTGPAINKSALDPINQYQNTNGVVFKIDPNDGVKYAFQILDTLGFNVTVNGVLRSVADSIPRMISPRNIIYCGQSGLVGIFDDLSPVFQFFEADTIFYAETLAVDTVGFPRGIFCSGNLHSSLGSALQYILLTDKGCFQNTLLGKDRYPSAANETSAYAHPTSLSWSDTRSELVVLDGDAGAQWVFNLAQMSPNSTAFKAGSVVSPGPIQEAGNALGNLLFGPSVLTNFITDGGAYYVIYDGANDLYIYYNEKHAYSVAVIETAPGAALEYVNHLDIVAVLGGTISPGSAFQTQQSPAGFYVLDVGTTVGGMVWIIDTSTMQPVVIAAGTGDIVQGWDMTPAGDRPNDFTPCYSPYGQGGCIYTVEAPPSSVDPTQPDVPGIALYRPASGSTITLGQVVLDICLRCGLKATQVDVTELTEELYGYTISQEVSGRVAIEQLQEVYLFDMVESGGKLVARHQAIQAQLIQTTVNANDLGARSGAPLPGANPVPRINEKVKQDFELPAALTLRYRTTEGNFRVRDFCMEPAAQYARRISSVISGTGNVSISSPVVLDDIQAATIAATVLRLQYVQRTSLTFALPIPYIVIEPGDVIQVEWTDPENNDVTYDMYVQQADLGADNTIKISGVSTNAKAYTGSAAAQSQLDGTVPMAFGQATTLVVMELPPLQDADDNVGDYWGACGVGTSYGWSATIYRSLDGGQTYTTIGTDDIPAIIGITKGALSGGATADISDQLGSAVWDTVNSFTVSLTAGTPESFTPLSVLNHNGIYLVGKEIVGACNAVENTDKTWTFSLLIRGMQGTDMYIDTHIAGETVVALALDGSISTKTFDQSQVGVEADWTALSSGADLSTAQKVNATLQGTRIMPLRAARAAITRDSGNNATIIWSPRRRIGIEWQDGVELGVDEATEEYSIDIISPATGVAVRTITAFTKITGTVGDTAGADTGARSVAYSYANQLTDGLVGAGAAWETPTAHFTVSADGLTAVKADGVSASINSNFGATTGKFYFEATGSLLGDNADQVGVGTAASGALANRQVYPGNFGTGVACFAVDLVNKRFWSRSNPTALWNDSATADPANNIGGTDISSGVGSFFVYFYSVNAPGTALANFGASLFAGVIPAGFSAGWPGPLAPPITTSIYQVSDRIGRGFPRSIIAG
jgi:Putative phage tail protein